MDAHAFTRVCPLLNRAPRTIVVRMERYWSANGLLLAAGLMAGCSSEVRIEDGGGGDDGGTAQSTSGAGAGPTGAGGGGTGTGVPYGQQIEDACREVCLSGCGENVDCTDQCVSGFANVLPGCTDETVALLGCMKKPEGSTLDCPDAYDDCYDLLMAYYDCQNPLDCGSQGDILECASTGGSSCDCSGDCAGDHRAGASCTYDNETETEICDCSFDGVVVGQCQQVFQSSCDIRSTVCCAPFWR